MRITGFALAWAVRDVADTSDFYVSHFSFKPTVITDHFIKVVHDDHPDYELCFIQQRADGPYVPHAATLAFVVTDATSEQQRLRDAGVTITLPLMDEPWGERLFQVRDPDGVTVQLVQWVTPAPGWIQPAPETGYQPHDQ